MGWITMWYDRDWPGAERHLRRAIELNPSYSWASSWFAAYLAATGRVEESLPVILDAYTLDPLSYIHATYVGTHYLWLRRDAEAISYFSKALEISPQFFMAHWGLGRAYLGQGRYQDAVAELAFEGGDFTGLHRAGLLGYAHARAGNATEARRILADLEQKAARSEYVPPVDPAIILIGLGETETALGWLERLVADRGARIFLEDPIFDPVRSHVRFQRLLERLGLR
jgi:tetratricopeptide (TPR) repeat protein